MRKYDKPYDFFHNYEHDPKGRTHCKGPPSNPYTIEHVGGKHKISLRFAKGHGRAKKITWFEFTKKLDDGWELESGKQVDKEEVDNKVAKKKTKKWIQAADLKEGAFTAWCKARGFGGVNAACIAAGKKSKDSTTVKRANLAATFKKMAKGRKK